MSVITIPRSIRERLGDDASEDFAALINDIDMGARKDAIAIAEERFERRLSEESGKLRLEIEKLRSEMSTTKAEIIKWMFLFWIGQTAVIVALLKFFIK
ncbi:MAG: CCDC90 family protein [Candidatus Magnetominusculus sp. LBB02]|nr:CCDC90 family protein [Candidatus Magnetominusculus sp. LBB02]